MYTENKGFFILCFDTHYFSFHCFFSLSYTRINSDRHTHRITHRNGLKKMKKNYIFCVCVCLCVTLWVVPTSAPACKHTENRMANQDLVSLWFYFFHMSLIVVRCNCWARAALQPDLRHRCASQTKIWPMMLWPQVLAHMDAHNDW